MGRTRITTEALDRILRLRRTKTIRQTARQMDLSPTTVGQYCDKQLAEVLRRWTPPNERPNERPDASGPANRPFDGGNAAHNPRDFREH
jgi:hypothetical protein